VKTFRIADVERLTGVRAHVLRYWEKQAPILGPAKDEYGRREYSMRDVELLLRLKYLIQEKHYTIEGASEALLTEMVSGSQDAVAKLNEIRDELLGLFSIARERAEGGTSGADEESAKKPTCL
jgi:DNA-binding transcriptional MerR regulator